MLECYKDREIKAGQSVKVYFNLHKRVFSIKDKKTGLVIAHGNNIQLKNPVFQVLESGRQRVLKEKQKNIHAYVTGELIGIGELDADVKRQYDRVNYNPYKAGKFVVNQSEQDANSKGYSFAVLIDKQILAK